MRSDLYNYKLSYIAQLVWIINTVEFTMVKSVFKDKLIKTIAITIQSQNLTILSTYIGFNDKNNSITFLHKQVTKLITQFNENYLILVGDITWTS